MLYGALARCNVIKSTGAKMPMNGGQIVGTQPGRQLHMLHSTPVNTLELLQDRHTDLSSRSAYMSRTADGPDFSRLHYGSHCAAV